MARAGREKGTDAIERPDIQEFGDEQDGLEIADSDPGELEEGPTCCVLEPLTLLTRDLKAAAATLKPREARYMVDAYYSVQKERVSTGNRISSMQEEPHLLLLWQQDQLQKFERSVQGALDVFSRSSELGRWVRSLWGFGPVLSSGLLAHISVRYYDADGVEHIVRTAGQVWSFAGLNPTAVWKKGEKRPWNAKLKVLAWKVGSQIKRGHTNEKCVYGPLYTQRKALEVARNEAGLNRVVAEERLKKNPPDKSTPAYAAYAKGKLPDGRVDLRAMRYATKIFLAHYQHVAYEIEFGEPPPKPYVIDKLGHTHYMGPPNWPMKP